MLKIKKLIKNSRIWLLAIVLMFISFPPVHAMKRIKCNSQFLPHQLLQKKYFEEPLLKSSATQSKREGPLPKAIRPPLPKMIPIAPTSFVSPFSPVVYTVHYPPQRTFNPLEVLSIQTFYNNRTGCFTLRVDPERGYQSGQKLESDFLTSYIESRKQKFFDRFKITKPISTNAFEIFDTICIDNRIETDLPQALNADNWLIFSKELNATIYINKQHLEKLQKIDPNVLEEIIFFALYVG